MRRAPWLALLALGCSVPLDGTPVDDPDAPTWFQDLGPLSPSHPTEVRGRAVELAFALVPDGFAPYADATAVERMTLPLFDDVTVVVERTDLDNRIDGATWRGRLADRADGDAILAIRGHRVAGTVVVGDTTYALRPLADGRHALYELDLAVLPPGSEPIRPPSERAAMPATAADGAASIDVMVAWTDGALAWADDRDGIRALADLAVSETNASYADSGVAQRIRVVHTVHVEGYDDRVSYGTTVGRLADPTDGFLDDLPALRDAHGADLVVLLATPSTTTCGIAYQMTSIDARFAPYGYGVVSTECAAANYSFAHELGHNMGATHDHDNATFGATATAFGYRDVDAGFRTIMAYACETGSCKRVRRWSNPDLSWFGATTGVAGTGADAADNHATLDTTAATVAAFRDRVETSAPDAATLTSPRDGATLIGPEQIVTWTDTGASSYLLTVGSESGARDVYGGFETSGNRLTLSDLPTDGRALYASLWTDTGDGWLRTEARWIASHVATVVEPVILDPEPGSTLPGADVRFTWEATASKYSLLVGTSEGGDDLGRYETRATSTEVTGLPEDGRTVYVTLVGRTGDDRASTTADYRATSTEEVAEPATLLSPADGATLHSGAARFAWTDTGETYRLELGLAEGSQDLASVDTDDATALVEGLPRTGAPLFVRLWTSVGDGWARTDAMLTLDTATGTEPATLLSPDPREPLAARPVLEWDDTDAQLYYVEVRVDGDVVFSDTVGTLTRLWLDDLEPEPDSDVAITLGSMLDGRWFTRTTHYLAQ